MNIEIATTTDESIIVVDASYHLDTDDGVLIITTDTSEGFFNWDHVAYFIAEDQDE